MSVGLSEHILFSPQVIKEINKAIPTLENGTKKRTAVHGDGASVQAVAKVKRNAISEIAHDRKPHPTLRFDTVLPVPGELHRRMLLNQDTKDLLETNSAAQRGTLENIMVTANVK